MRRSDGRTGVGVVAGALVLWGAGAHLGAAQPAAAPANAGADVQPIDGAEFVARLRALGERWTRYDEFIDHFAHVDTHGLGLRVDDDAPPGTRGALLEILTADAALIEDVIAVSRLMPSALEPEPAGWQPGDHLRRPRSLVQNFERLLRADAARAWDAGDHAGAVRRMAAGARLGVVLMVRGDESQRSSGLTIGVFSARGSGRMLAGEGVELEPGVLVELREAFAPLDRTDPSRLVLTWMVEQQEMLNDWEVRYADAPGEYVEMMSAWGDAIREAAAQTMQFATVGSVDLWTLAADVRPSTRDFAGRRLTREDMGEGFAAAREAVYPLAAAIRRDDVYFLRGVARASTPSRLEAFLVANAAETLMLLRVSRQLLAEFDAALAEAERRAEARQPGAASPSAR